MIPGLNTDVRHKGKTFHIQTEDSGPENPVLITHVFLGGTILGTQRQNYGEDNEELEVRERMRTQHRAMYHALLEGRFDDAARRPPRAKPSKSSIPLAKKRRGIHTGARSSTRTSQPPAPDPEDGSVDTEDVDTEDVDADADAARRSTPPALSPPERKTVAAPMLLNTDEITELSILDIQPAEPRLAFPTALTGARPLADLALAYLIEEPDET